jgi:hypothetical protein
VLRKSQAAASPQREAAARWRAAVLQSYRDLLKRYPREYPALECQLHRNAWSHAH